MSLTKNGNLGPVYQPDIMQLSNIVDSDQIVNASTTLVDIPQLDLNVDANERVLLRYTIFYKTVAAADIKYQIDIPASPTQFRQFTEGFAPDDTAFDLALASAEGSVSILGASNTEGFLRVTALLENGANAGTVSFQFAQVSSNASDTTVYAGSFLEYRRF